MAIYDFSKVEETEFTSPEPQKQKEAEPDAKSRLFSSLVARLFFLLLLAADVLWACYAVLLLTIALLGQLLSANKVTQFEALRKTGWIALRRALVCGVSLFLALFHPAFGIMIACTYFLMYDKSGIEEIVPSSLQSQFKSFLHQE